ncbi:MAG TPA: RimK family alpha-L-glutamate ligase, partial [Candidatus Aenigmarchaeota archaeon]|nr:RimK family alpha-L-glutamate ligase [Candidatus Aenigmarchaeota archaeon]
PSVVVEREKVLFGKLNLKNFDCIIPRIPRTYAWYGYILLHMLKDTCYLPITPESVILGHNKFLTLVILKEANLPVPETYLASSRSVLEKMLNKMKYPVVMKLLYGSLGRGVMFVDSPESAKSVMDALERFRQPIFLEEFIENPGEDIRVFVLGDEVLAAMKRKAKRGERRTNIGIGGKGEMIKSLDPEIEEIAIKAAHALGMQICGVDIIEGNKGPVIIEANVNVHFEGLARATKINVAREIVKFVLEEGKKFKKPFLRRLFKWFSKHFI